MNRHTFLIVVAATVVFLLGADTLRADDTDEGAYGIRQMRSENGQRQVIRFNRKSGEAWFNWTTSAPVWSKIAESGPVPAGIYDVMLLPGTSPDNAWAIRFDHNSGKTWNFGQKGWEEFSEPKP